MTTADVRKQILNGLDEIREDLTDLYRDLHAHPELSFAEHRTAEEVVRRATALGYDVTAGVGRTGVVAVLRNGDGPTVLLRADFDALPVREQTGLPYASTVTGTDPDGNEVPVMHACAHDMHVTCLLGTMKLLVDNRDTWSGTLLAVFQPAEEIGHGAQAMVDDNFFQRFGEPDIVLSQHVIPMPAGMLACHAGPTFSSADGLKVQMYGRGAHGSMPAASIDPVVMAAATVMRLQTIVSREVAPSETAVVTVGSLQAGTKGNIIPDEAELRVNIRAYNQPTRDHLIGAVGRIVRAEAAASGAEKDPDITPMESFPILVNDEEATTRTVAALVEQFGETNVVDSGPLSGSEDCGIFATASGKPICYWTIGGVDPKQYGAALEAGTVHRDIPTNHSPFFAPVIEPTLTTGVTAMTTAALAWLAPGGR